MRVRFLGLTAGIILLTRGAFAQAPVSPAAPPRDAVLSPSIGTAQLRGRVVTADSGAPLRRAQVRAVAIGNQTTRITSTDTEGRYEFVNLPAGRYSLSVSQASYVTLQFGQRYPFESGRPLELVDGQTVDAIDFALPIGKQSRLVGFAKNARGERESNYRLVVYPANLRPGDVGVRFQHNASPVKGQTTINRMPPGEYVGLAVKGVQPGEEWDPDLRKRIEQLGRRFALKEGETLELEFPIVE